MENTAEEEKKDSFHLIEDKVHSKSDWDLGELYGRAKDIVRNHKVTWIFGAAVASLASASSNSNSNSSSNSNSFDPAKLQDFYHSLPSTQQAGQKISMVLGESTSPFQQFLNDLWSLIPVWIYVLLGFEVLILVVFGICIRVVYGAWAQASLISSVQDAHLNQKPTLASAAAVGFKNTKSFFLLSLIPALIMMVVFLVSLVVFIILFSLGSTVLNVFAGILLFIEVLVVIYFLCMMNVALIWGFREILVSGKGVKQALYAGWAIARRKFWASVLLGLVNSILGAIILSVPWIVFGVFVVGGFVAFMNNLISIWAIGYAVPLFIVCWVITTVMGGIIEAFKAATWTIAYDKIKGKYDN